MNELERDQQNQQPENRPDQVEDSAMEYQLDHNEAEQIQGKLAADNMEDLDAPQDGESQKEALKEDPGNVVPEEEMRDDKVERTDQQIQ